MACGPLPVVTAGHPPRSRAFSRPIDRPTPANSCDSWAGARFPHGAKSIERRARAVCAELARVTNSRPVHWRTVDLIVAGAGWTVRRQTMPSPSRPARIGFSRKASRRKASASRKAGASWSPS